MAKLKVAILFGGANTEHEVSLKSATNIIHNIDTDEFETVLIGITKKGRWLYYPGDVSLIATGEWQNHPDCVTAFLSPDTTTRGIVKVLDDGTFIKEKIDVVFPVLHGKNGEDGTVQGLLELSQIPYVGCQVLASAACMDKVVTNIMFDAHGIRHTKWEYLTADDMQNIEEKAKEVEQNLKYPLYVKPANSGSSVGVTMAVNLEELIVGIKTAFAHDKRVLVEQGIKGREVEVAVMGNNQLQAPLVGEVLSAVEGFYDYESKYVNPASQTVIPADLPEEVTEELLETAKKAFKALDCTGLSRIDFFVEDDTNLVYLNEINTLPGFTQISMFPQLFQEAGMSYTEIITNLIGLALDKRDTQ